MRSSTEATEGDFVGTSKWHQIDQAAVIKLLEVTQTPGLVVPLSTTALPNSLQPIPGAISYYASAYLTQVPSPVVTIGGEMVVVRTDGDLAKGYNYVFGTSSNGNVCFAGPEKYFDAHHSPSSNPARVESMFGHFPSSPKK
jgi:hypothetical protein